MLPCRGTMCWSCCMGSWEYICCKHTDDTLDKQVTYNEVGKLTSSLLV